MRLRNNKNREVYKEMKKGIFLWSLLGCLLLAGCQKETAVEEGQADNTSFIISVSENSIQSRLMSGDFECLDNDTEYVESVKKAYNWTMNGLKDGQWRLIDLNGDGTEDLILEEKEAVTADSEEKRIIGIFACYEDKARCVLWDVNDLTEYFFCGLTGELMYSASSYGGVVSEEPYAHYYFDSEWNGITDYTIAVYRIDAAMNEEYAEKWRNENPDMAEDGIYFRKYTEEGVEVLTRKELENIYEMETGYEFHSEFY